MKSFYITTPIYYVNDKPHIGHAYSTIACDVLARFKRLDGFDVFFLTGTDEHGQKVAQAAAKAGLDPQAFTDQVSQNFRDVLPKLNISNSQFIRTTEARHKRSVQELWTKMVAAGDIYLGTYAGWYAMRDEAFYAEDEIKIGADGKKYSPFDSEVTWVEEKSYFFRLSAWGDRLLKFYNDNPDFIAPETRRNEVLSFVRGGLNDLSISRTNFKWGIPVPGDPDHVMYVWVDALTNYITGVGYPDQDTASFQKFWPADVHIVGKDIIRFHTVYWPAFLMSAGIAPPKRVFANGWLLSGGKKMSKSWGNVISPDDMLARYGVDGTRYLMMAMIPFGNDGDITHKTALPRVNNDLANGLGNLVQRTMSFIYKNSDATIPTPGTYAPDDLSLLKQVQVDLLPAVRAEMDRQRFDLAVEIIMRAVSAANTYIDAQAPWGLKKTDPARMNTVLYVLSETIRCLGLIMQPLTPDLAAKILDTVAAPPDARTFRYLSSDAALKPGTSINEPKGVFPRLEVAEDAA
jgi:methionyl-tRNA synthetase